MPKQTRTQAKVEEIFARMNPDHVAKVRNLITLFENNIQVSLAEILSDAAAADDETFEKARYKLHKYAGNTEPIREMVTKYRAMKLARNTPKADRGLVSQPLVQRDQVWKRLAEVKDDSMRRRIGANVQRWSFRVHLDVASLLIDAHRAHSLEQAEQTLSVFQKSELTASVVRYLRLELALDPKP